MIPAQNNETRSVQGNGFQETNQKTDSAIVALAEKIGNCDKPNLIARLARAGHVVHECSEQSFTVVNPRWGMSRYCENYAALIAFALQVGVRT